MRQAFAALFALAVLGGVALGVQQLLSAGVPGTAPEDPADLAAEWAAAVEQGDLEALGERVTPRVDPDVLAGTHVTLLDAIEGRPRSVTVGPVTVQQDEGRATVSLATAVEVLPGGQPWTWESRLLLERAGGRWSVDWTPAALHPELREGWTLSLRDEDPVRAPVLDRRGRTLSSSADVVEIGVEPGRLPGVERVVPVLGRVLPQAIDPLLELLADEDTVDEWYYPLTTVDAATADAVWVDLIALPGMLRRDGEGGEGPAPYAPEVVGAVVEEDGVLRGTSGLQGALDDRLAGSGVRAVVLSDAGGDERRVLHEAQTDPSPPLVTTLDRDVQQALQDALLVVDQPLAVVAVDVATGGVAGVVSRPATGFARALEGRYPPGPLAGVVTVTAALQQGVGTDRPVVCPGSVVAGGVQVSTGSGDGGERTLLGALAPGCATGLATLGAGLAGPDLDAAGALLGLDVEPRLPVAAVGWDAPTPGTDAAVASAAIGHGRVQASALSVAALMGTIARGQPVPPFLLADAAPPPRPALDTGLSVALRQALASAGGTDGVDVDGVDLPGTTARTGLVRGDPAPATGWWAGWIAGGGPEVAVAVVVEGDDGRRAAELAERVVAELSGG